MDQDCYALLLAIGTCHDLLKDHARQVRQHPDVCDVAHWLDAHTLGNAFQMTGFVDAELRNGEAISWRLELNLSRASFTIESDVRSIHRKGQDVIEVVAEVTYPAAEACAAGLLDTARHLCAAHPIGQPGRT